MDENRNEIECPQCGMPLAPDDTFCPNCNTAFDTDERFANRAAEALNTGGEDEDDGSANLAFGFDDIDFGVTDEELIEAFRPKSMPSASPIAASVASAAASTAVATGSTAVVAAAIAASVDAADAAADATTVAASVATGFATVNAMAGDAAASTAAEASGLGTDETVPKTAGAAAAALAGAVPNSPVHAAADADATVAMRARDDLSHAPTAVLPKEPERPARATCAPVPAGAPAEANGAAPAASAAASAEPAFVAPAKASPKPKARIAAAIGAIAVAALAAGAIFLNAGPHEADYTVAYLDQATMAEIADAQTATGHVDDAVTASAVQVEGYRLAGDETQSITLREDGENAIEFLYAKVVPYTVEYLDQDGATIAPAKVSKDHVEGESVTETAPDFDGYELASSDIFVLTIGADEKTNTMTFVYTKKATYTVRCVTSGGEELRSTEGKGLVGDEVTEEAPSIDDYNLTSDAKQTIKLAKDGKDNVITFTYEPVPVYTPPVQTYTPPVQTPTPSQPTTPTRETVEVG